MAGNTTRSRFTSAGPADVITVFLCGDVMTGRGIDQILPHPSKPVLYESYVTDARNYVALAESANGPIAKPVSHSYIWGDALDELESISPNARIINLETSVTTSDDYWKGKGINYRMHPKNIPSITAAKIDVCVLANNHVLDWGYKGLLETIETLEKAKILIAGAGRNLDEAETPAILDFGAKGRVLVFSFGSPTSGAPLSWAAGANRPGVNVISSLSDDTVDHIARKVGGIRRGRDIVIASVHWGGNWGFEISRREIKFAHHLIDRAGIDVVFGHSSHHVKGMEVYRGKLILYGCGDFLDDYEGITGYEEFRDDLGLMYFASLDPSTGRLIRLRMTPMQIRNFKVNRASKIDALWLKGTLTREGRPFGTRVELEEDNTLALHWEQSG